MRTSWSTFFRRVATLCFVAGSTAWSSAVCYAQIAADNASNAAYADGWQAGDNGGFGFTPWNFDNDTLFHVEGVRDINGPPSQSSFNQLGTAWRLGLNYLDEGNDIVRVGRGLSTPLQVGQTVSVFADIPTEHRFFGGIFIRLNTGGGSICYGGMACSPGTTPQPRFGLTTFNYTEFDNWGRWSATGIGYTTLFAKDKAPGEHPEFLQGAAGTNMGMRVDFKLTGEETYDVTLTPLDEPARGFTGSGVLDNPGAGSIDWIEFTHFMSPSNESFETDVYIRSLEVTGGAQVTGDFDGDGDTDGDDFLRWQRGLGTSTGATLGQGDGDADGDVDADDLTIWRNQYGPGAVAASSGVPEPECLLLGQLGAMGVSRLGARRAQRARRAACRREPS